jgi:dethiobiotin synthetase
MNLNASYFVAGTDTGVGKTRVTGAVLAAARQKGVRAAGMKPIATGCFLKDGRLISEDALYISQNSQQISAYDQLNPYALAEPLSPHIAARRAGVRIDIERIVEAARALAQAHELLLIEGTGGWLAPIDGGRTMADVARALALPVVLVVGLRLGCLNHAQLTAAAIRATPLGLRGWIGSHIDADFAAGGENIDTLSELLGGAPLALLAHRADNGADAGACRAALAQLLAS